MKVFGGSWDFSTKTKEKKSPILLPENANATARVPARRRHVHLLVPEVTVTPEGGRVCTGPQRTVEVVAGAVCGSTVRIGKKK